MGPTASRPHRIGRLRARSPEPGPVTQCDDLYRNLVTPADSAPVANRPVVVARATRSASYGATGHVGDDLLHVVMVLPLGLDQPALSCDRRAGCAVIRGAGFCRFLIKDDAMRLLTYFPGRLTTVAAIARLVKVP
jgi:hypothetical protein